MAKRKQKIFAIIDIETTGGMSKRDKITEIAVVLHDGVNVLKQFDTLINPERSIPFEITRITGITNDMVSNAPKFYEVAKQIVEITEGAIFVAHNVRFDYSFIKEEFARLGYTYTRKQLCTVRMARKAFPGLKSYSLGNLIKYFGINVSARHRALDDTLATVELFEKMLHESNHREDVHVMINQGIREQKLPEAISLQTLEELPEKAGVYYFHDEMGKVVYVGKSINIKSRVKQHFSKISTKSNALIRQVNNITLEVTGSELIALLLESEEIKNLQPIINKTQRNKDYPYFIHHRLDDDGYIVFELEKVNKKNIANKNIVSYYSSMSSGKGGLSKIRSLFRLCESKIYVKGKKTDRCIYYMMEDCEGACIDQEIAEDYNERAQMAIHYFQRVFDEDFFIITEGRSDDEAGIILVKDKHYRGFGYMLKSDINQGTEELMESIDFKRSNVECNGLIVTYLQSHSDFELLPISEN